MNLVSKLAGAALIAALSTSALAITYTSPWNNQAQIHDMWCWNASVRNLIYTESNGSKNLTQCSVANYAFNVNYTCSYNNVFAWNNAANRGNWLSCPTCSDKDDVRILKYHGYNTTVYSGAPSFTSIQTSINRNHGMLTDWHWKNGGGHIVLVNGYDVQSGNGSRWIALYNPWPGEGQLWQTYAEYVGGSSSAYDHTTNQVVAVP